MLIFGKHLLISCFLGKGDIGVFPFPDLGVAIGVNSLIRSHVVEYDLL